MNHQQIFTTIDELIKKLPLNKITTAQILKTPFKENKDVPEGGGYRSFTGSSEIFSEIEAQFYYDPYWKIDGAIILVFTEPIKPENIVKYYGPDSQNYYYATQGPIWNGYLYYNRKIDKKRSYTLRFGYKDYSRDIRYGILFWPAEDTSSSMRKQFYIETRE